MGQSHPGSSRDRMKAQVFLPSLLLVLHSCRSNVLHKRSLLGESHIDPSGHHGGHHGHHHNHIPHHGDEHGVVRARHHVDEEGAVHARHHVDEDGIVHSRTVADLEGGHLVASAPGDSYLPPADYEYEEILPSYIADQVSYGPIVPSLD